MPLYYFTCPECSTSIRRLLDSEQIEKVVQVCKCGNEMERDAQGATSRIVEVLDNGVMVRRLERPAEAEKVYKDWADQGKGNAIK